MEDVAPMEVVATAGICRVQLWQWVRHGVVEGASLTAADVRRIGDWERLRSPATGGTGLAPEIYHGR